MRIRTIKPEFWTHPVLSRGPHEARLAAIGILNLADDDGYFLADAALIRSALWPFDEDSTNARRALDWLMKVGYIEVRDSTSHGPIGLVINFSKHQRIDRPTPSKLACYVTSSSPRRILDEPSLLEGKGKEQGKEQGTVITGAAEDALRVLARLNELTHREFRAVDSNLNLIKARLKEPEVTVDGVLAMVERQVAKWSQDPKMREFLRPETLFGKEKFDGYHAARLEPVLDIIHHGPRTTHQRSSRAAIIAERNATLGPGSDEQAADARARSQAIDDANAERFERTGLTAFDADPTPVSGESPGA